jgi:hypothetical protein
MHAFVGSEQALRAGDVWEPSMHFADASCGIIPQSDVLGAFFHQIVRVRVTPVEA